MEVARVPAPGMSQSSALLGQGWCSYTPSNQSGNRPHSSESAAVCPDTARHCLARWGYLHRHPHDGSCREAGPAPEWTSGTWHCPPSSSPRERRNGTPAVTHFSYKTAQLTWHKRQPPLQPPTIPLTRARAEESFSNRRPIYDGPDLRVPTLCVRERLTLAPSPAREPIPRDPAAHFRGQQLPGQLLPLRVPVVLLQSALRREGPCCSPTCPPRPGRESGTCHHEVPPFSL